MNAVARIGIRKQELLSRVYEQRGFSDRAYPSVQFRVAHALAKVGHRRFGPLEASALHQCSKDPARAGACIGMLAYGGSLPKAEQRKFQLIMNYSSGHTSLSMHA